MYYYLNNNSINLKKITILYIAECILVLIATMGMKTVHFDIIHLPTGLNTKLPICHSHKPLSV